LWSLSASSSSYESYEVSSYFIQHLVDEMVMPMQSSADTTSLLGGDSPSNHVVLQPIHPVVDEVVMSMKSSVDPTLLLESVKSTKVVTSM
jgi:hypothetical protein